MLLPNCYQMSKIEKEPNWVLDQALIKVNNVLPTNAPAWCETEARRKRSSPTMAENKKETSSRVASEAAKQLASKTESKAEKSVAGSALSQTKPPTKPKK